MSQHFVVMCEYGTVHGQCRCPAKDKYVKRIECPSPRACAMKTGTVAAKHRKDVTPDASAT